MADSSWMKKEERMLADTARTAFLFYLFAVVVSIGVLFSPPCPRSCGVCLFISAFHAALTRAVVLSLPDAVALEYNSSCCGDL